MTLKEKRQCIHHYMLDEGQMGICKKCGAIKYFMSDVPKKMARLDKFPQDSFRNPAFDGFPKTTRHIKSFK
jgi:hypothetical protein